MATFGHEEQLYNKGEKVLCYEPDKSKARVLYDSKVLAVYECQDVRKFRYFNYKIHFQGWNSVWDRNVRSAELLKDNEENRQLQRDLAEAANLQKSSGYFYKDTKPPAVPPTKKRRLARGGQAEKFQNDPLDISVAQQPTTSHTAMLPPPPRTGGRKPKQDKNANTVIGEAENVAMKTTRKSKFSMVNPPKETPKPKPEPEKPQDDRVLLRISERLQKYMEYEYTMFCKLGKQHVLPARVPIVTILESFVKQRAVELAISIKQDSTRARNTTSRNSRMELEYDRVMSNVCMLKEVVDGLRIYFEFYMTDHLLYKGEKGKLVPHVTRISMRKAQVKLNDSYGDDGPITGGVAYENELEKCLEYIVKDMANDNTTHNFDRRFSPYTAAYKLPEEMRGFLCETFSWRMLSAESPPELCMIFGAPHLARLLIKMPEFLNASSMPNNKLQDLLNHMNTFINYVENHKEWFDKDNYVIDE